MAGPPTTHPSKIMWLATTVLLLMAISFLAAAAVYPGMSRIPGTVGIRALVDGGHLTGMVSTDYDRWSTVNIGLWRWCLEYGDRSQSRICSSTTRAGIPAFGSSKCRGLMLLARHTNWIAGVFFFFALVLSVLCFLKCSKWSPGKTWMPPSGPALLAIPMSIIGTGLAITCWVSWIFLMEETCRGGLVAWDPIQGYSTSFIFMCWSTGLAALSIFTAAMGYQKLNNITVFVEEDGRDIGEVRYVDDAGTVDVTYADTYQHATVY